MTSIDVKRELHGEEPWKLYFDAFRRINPLAVQRHLWTRQEFDQVMGDPRVSKYTATNDSVLDGLATYTNNLDAVPLISAEYFEHRWPVLYASRRIFYCGFVGVAPHRHASETFGALVAAMYRVAYHAHATICLDLCSFNAVERNMANVIPLMMRRLDSGVISQRLDQQSYWGYIPSTVEPA